VLKELLLLREGPEFPQSDQDLSGFHERPRDGSNSQSVHEACENRVKDPVQCRTEDKKVGRSWGRIAGMCCSRKCCRTVSSNHSFHFTSHVRFEFHVFFAEKGISI
jgi:hypothetical protein